MGCDYYVVMTTYSESDTAVKVAKKMVESRLAGCCNVIPGIRSIYSWQGEMCDESECILMLKTGHVKLNELIEKIRELHTYKLPEIIAFPIPEGDEDYLRWIWDWVSAKL